MNAIRRMMAVLPSMSVGKVIVTKELKSPFNVGHQQNRSISYLFGLKNNFLDSMTRICNPVTSSFTKQSKRCLITDVVTCDEWQEQRKLIHIHNRGPIKPRKRRHPLNERPQMKGIVIKTIIKKPKKPNSANRKCVLVKLSNGKEAIAYVPGIGHNLQEHSVVLVHNKRTKDVPGLKLRCMRGHYDLPEVQSKSQTPQ